MPSTEKTHFNIPNTMRAVVLNEPNTQLATTDSILPIPTCNDNELLVKVEYVGLNPNDAHFAQSGFCKWQYPHILGLDAVGVVVKANKGVFPGVGTRVMWHANLGGEGTLSEYSCVPNFAVSVVPDELCSSIAATLPCSGMAALVSLDKLEVSEGDTIFIDGGSGAVGQFAIQYAKQRGVDVFTTASKHNHKLVKNLGADAVFDYNDKQLIEKIKRQLGPQGFDAVIDTVGGESTTRNIELMRFCGRIACLNTLPHLDSELMFRKSPTICIVSLGGAWLANSLCAQQRLSFMGNLLLEGAVTGDIKHPKIVEVAFNARAVSDALTAQLTGSITGKHVVKIAP
ncbi:zinc-binding dehydrogenase [Pseudoalteromonas sp. MMG010]|uniref:zinc-binding dehydrogenase n=1 Tax=Pseudoalteromonas sp. MMG010 TaxID=2822685 RepID=UPI001B39CF80|nr:zinc-binding dehydrogenase [Pseudoalteromonas sp. MMG010]MBQ4833690.1 zinc-binding dehydrogenase [Pseudoalteromonas sp. MMG010]